MSGKFELVSDYTLKGDQPEAVKQLVENLRHGIQDQVLLGATGTGKTFAMANVVKELNRPTLVMAPNKTLAAQLLMNLKLCSRIMLLNILSVITTITSLKHTCRILIRI